MHLVGATAFVNCDGLFNFSLTVQTASMALKSNPIQRHENLSKTFRLRNVALATVLSQFVRWQREISAE
jgi:hypothetical protein